VNHYPQVDLVGVGLNATDTLLVVPQLPDSGSKVEFASATVLPGGQVATAVIACRQWGLKTRYVGKLGDDPAAHTHRQEFARAGVETQITSVEGCFSAQSFILVDPRGERTVLWRRDQRLELKPEDIDREWIVNARALLVDGADTAAATQAAKWARAANLSVVADLDQPYPGLDALLENIDYLIVSRDFPAKLTGEADLREALFTLQRRFGCRLTAATLGADGVLTWNGAEFVYSSAFRVGVVDTTGAGDIFHAGFIYGLLQNWPIQQVLDFSCAAAALNCTAVGARGRIEKLENIQALMSNGQRYPAAY
jgi:sugar/nucleoside kinase (ribokinase family)